MCVSNLTRKTNAGPAQWDWPIEEEKNSGKICPPVIGMSMHCPCLLRHVSQSTTPGRPESSLMVDQRGHDLNILHYYLPVNKVRYVDVIWTYERYKMKEFKETAS